jgi:hypothetical protein
MTFSRPERRAPAGLSPPATQGGRPLSGHDRPALAPAGLPARREKQTRWRSLSRLTSPAGRAQWRRSSDEIASRWRDPICPKAAASRAGEGGRRSAVGPADPRVQPEHRQGLMTISMPDRFRLAAPRGRRRRIGMAMGLLEQSRLASCSRPGRTKSTPLTRRRIAVWRLEWPPRVARARRDRRDGSCASGRPRDVGHRCERWRALERERGAAFEPPLASQVLLGIKQFEPNGQVLLRRPGCVRGHSGPPGFGGLPSAY